jgi:hypothetical protein
MEARTSLLGDGSWGGIALLVAAVLAALALLWMASEAHVSSCVEKAEAKFPATPVSAFNGKATGPLKVSFVKERTAAVEDCGRI